MINYLKIPKFVIFDSNLTQFGPKLNTPGLSRFFLLSDVDLIVEMLVSCLTPYSADITVIFFTPFDASGYFCRDLNN